MPRASSANAFSGPQYRDFLHEPSLFRQYVKRSEVEDGYSRCQSTARDP
jgi:hypothetical protein